MIPFYDRNAKISGVLIDDVNHFLVGSGYPKTANHCSEVGIKAKELATKYDSDPVKAEQAGYLHDLSVVIPDVKIIGFAKNRSIEILDEEYRFPMIIHQKLSVILAREIFHITDDEVLSAVGCHTTLKANAKLLDKVVFPANKIA